MTEYLIGCGGWAYFKVPGLKPLDAYARAYNFVEMNATFYEIPKLQTVHSWRKRVPPDFEFAVRCHKDVTHKYQLDPSQETFRIWDTMTEICAALGSRFLVLQTPPELHYSQQKIESIGNFFESVDNKGIKLAWEIRRMQGERIPPRLVALMNDHNMIHSVDISKEIPLTESDTVYTRVFGKGEHNIYQFTDDELEAIDKRISSTGSETAAVSFHNVRMYKDAARFRIYKETGVFPSVTGAEGQESLRRVLTEDAEFPTTKTRLLKDQGWKVFDLRKGRRVRARDLLDKLPDGRFGNVDEVLRYTGETLNEL